ncbi:uncharacterized protein [Halyomorpha halys]|nr:uncharacterized protein LOC106691752 isoform X2 [Halyomorpha halys]XP_024214749.1 uncharacterized protein LOC106691752 isoform X2 [Halyomorpha halys]
MNCHEIVYFPLIYGRHSFPTELAKFIWTCRSTRAKPDMVYLRQLRRYLLSAIHKFKASHNKIIINNLMLNDSLYCLNWFDHQSKLHIFEILTSCFREQKHLNWISAENTLLLIEDGLRLLLSISICCGLSLRALHLWYFFSAGALPIKTNNERTEEDPYIAYRTELDEIMMNYMFFCFVMRTDYTIPKIMQSLVLHVAYHNLEYLEILSVEYRYIAGSQGESLLYLGCLRHGTLRELNILFTRNDYVENTRRFVCASAWKKAYKICPCLRINFVAPEVTSFSSVLPVLVTCMPLEGFYASTGFRTDGGTIMFDKLVRSLITNFKKFLKKINLYLWRPRSPVDLIIAKLFMELTFLEEFTYRGPLENITSLHNILQYIEKNSLRIKKFHFYLTEDPCNPEPYIKAMNEIYEQYEPSFVDKGIHLKLETCQC